MPRGLVIWTTNVIDARGQTQHRAYQATRLADPEVLIADAIDSYRRSRPPSEFRLPLTVTVAREEPQDA